MGKKTYVCLILDRSGSMKSCREATLSGINEQIATIRMDAQEGGIETFVSYYTFNHRVEPKYKCRPVNYLNDITDYEIDGDTAMFDAVGQAIADLKAETDCNNPDNSYLIITATDGAERCSKRYTRESLARIISACQETGRWTFTYLGANQDLSKLAAELNIPLGNVANYKSDMGGAATAWTNTNRQLNTYLKLRKLGGSSMKSFHSNDGSIADYTKVNLDSIPPDFDYTKLNLEKAQPGENVDLDALLKLPTAKELPKSLFRNQV